jgi:hypothetical protein
MAVEAQAPCSVAIIIIITTDEYLRCRRFLQWKRKGWGKGAVEWVQKKTRFQKREDHVHASATKKNGNLLLFRNTFFLKL